MNPKIEELRSVDLCSFPKDNQIIAEEYHTPNFPDEILITIFSECGVKELVNLMLSSKLFYKNANNNQIWKSICLKEDPEISNKENLNWKQIYFNEIDFKKYFTNDDNKIFIQNSKNNTCYHLPTLKLIPGTITGKIFKKIIIKSLKLNCSLSEMRLIAGSNTIRDTADSLDIKSYLEKSKNQVKIDIKIDNIYK